MFEQEVHDVEAREGRGEVKRGGAGTGRVYGVWRYGPVGEQECDGFTWVEWMSTAAT